MSSLSGRFAPSTSDEHQKTFRPLPELIRCLGNRGYQHSCEEQSVKWCSQAECGGRTRVLLSRTLASCRCTCAHHVTLSEVIGGPCGLCETR